MAHYQSQAEGLLSQDSTYQTDPSYFAHSQSAGMSSQNVGYSNMSSGAGGGTQLSQF